MNSSSESRGDAVGHSYYHVKPRSLRGNHTKHAFFRNFLGAFFDRDFPRLAPTDKTHKLTVPAHFEASWLGRLAQRHCKAYLTPVYQYLVVSSCSFCRWSCSYCWKKAVELLWLEDWKFSSSKLAYFCPFS